MPDELPPSAKYRAWVEAENLERGGARVSDLANKLARFLNPSYQWTRADGPEPDAGEVARDLLLEAGEIHKQALILVVCMDASASPGGERWREKAIGMLTEGTLADEIAKLENLAAEAKKGRVI